MADAIRIDGLSEFVRSVKKLDSELPKAVRIGLNDAMGVVVGYARPKIPKRSGRAAASLKARSTRTEARVAAGGRRAEYYPWLDFGGKVGRKKSVKRPFIGDGRYLYPALTERRQQITDALQNALVSVAEAAGLEVE